LQVFYRDESQGILLGASLVSGKWNYELVDGDKATGGRTTGDVGFHLAASAIGKSVYVTYDSILSVNQDKAAIRGEVRQAVRSTIYPEDWTYSTLQASASGIAVAGFDVSSTVISNKISNAWFSASGVAIPNADQIQWSTNSGLPKNISPDAFGVPSSPIATNGSAILFGCNGRLCAATTSDETISLVSTGDFTNPGQVAWIAIAGKRYALAGVTGSLTLFQSI
jgi:hypothetical protein